MREKRNGGIEILSKEEIEKLPSRLHGYRSYPWWSEGFFTPMNQLKPGYRPTPSKKAKELARAEGKRWVSRIGVSFRTSEPGYFSYKVDL